jgi:hypothetical protein
MFKGAVSLRPVFVFAFSLACVVPPTDKGGATPAAAGSSANDNAVSIAHVLDPDDGTNPLHCVQKNTAAEHPVSAMTACVYEFSTTNPGTLYREVPTSREALQRNVLQQIVPGASK